jgi:protein-L-isoaspartate(D-aspartate) O-methyltransferase
MRRVERERFCSPARAFAAYAEVEPEIVPGRYLMKPRDIAKLLQLARPRAGETALAIAAPYAAAVLAVMGLKVTAQEADPKAASLLAPALDACGVDLVTSHLAKPAKKSVDLIVCEGAVSHLPDAWIAALSDRGRLAVVERNGPVGRAQLWMRTTQGASHGAGFDSTPPYLPGFEPQVAFQF